MMMSEMIKDINQLASSLNSSAKMPVIFIGHGSPMNALEINQFTQQWSDLGSILPNPQAIVVISAHWMTKGTHVTSAPKQPIIYDMYGFPPELYQFSYPAEGDPQLAKKIIKMLRNYESALENGWGLDHGTWSVLAHIMPKPMVPVLQISIDMNLGLQEQSDLFSSLRPLREKGVLFIGSGNIVHNLGMLDFSGKPYDWSLEFDNYARKSINNRDIRSLIRLDKVRSSSQLAIPTDEHYRPMLATMALANDDKNLDFFAEGIVMGSVSMRSFVSY